jgi:hypothetical protein
VCALGILALGTAYAPWYNAALQAAMSLAMH